MARNKAIYTDAQIARAVTIVQVYKNAGYRNFVMLAHEHLLEDIHFVGLPRRTLESWMAKHSVASTKICGDIEQSAHRATIEAIETIGGAKMAWLRQLELRLPMMRDAEMLKAGEIVAKFEAITAAQKQPDAPQHGFFATDYFSRASQQKDKLPPSMVAVN